MTTRRLCALAMVLALGLAAGCVGVTRSGTLPNGAVIHEADSPKSKATDVGAPRAAEATGQQTKTATAESGENASQKPKAAANWPFDAKEAKRRQTDAAQELGVPVVRKFPAGNLEMVFVPAGEFMMGSPAAELKRDRNEGPLHRVRITKPFYIGKFAITQRQWEALGEKNWSRWRFVGDCRQSPVEWVSWDDAQRFLKKLNERVKGKGTFTLPTEAEWEYACRAGTSSPFHVGETITAEQANFNGYYAYGKGARGVYRETTVKSGSFKPNAFGLYDMHGNVFEWCQDWYAFDYYKGMVTDDPQGPAKGDERVLRGGSWTNGPANCRSAARVKFKQDGRDIFLGFRVVFRDFK